MAKEILLFSRDDCGYCAKAHKAIAELKAENPAYGTLSLREVEETREPEFIEKFDYYAVPTLYLDGVKKFEAHIGMGYDFDVNYFLDYIEEKYTKLYQL